MTIDLIVAADEPALLFASVRDAEQYLEAIDVEDGVYSSAYGPNGEPYAIESDGKFVTITAINEPARPAEAKAIMTCYLAAIGQPVDECETLADLVSRCKPNCR